MTRKSKASIYDQHTRYFARNRLKIVDRPVMNTEEMRAFMLVVELSKEVNLLEERRQEILDKLHEQGFTDEEINRHVSAHKQALQIKDNTSD